MDICHKYMHLVYHLQTILKKYICYLVFMWTIHCLRFVLFVDICTLSSAIGVYVYYFLIGRAQMLLFVTCRTCRSLHTCYHTVTRLTRWATLHAETCKLEFIMMGGGWVLSCKIGHLTVVSHSSPHWTGQATVCSSVAGMLGSAAHTSR